MLGRKFLPFFLVISQYHEKVAFKVSSLFCQEKTFFTAEKLTLLRSVNNTARVDIDGSGSYTVIFIQDGVSRVVTINGGSNSTIKITQDN